MATPIDDIMGDLADEYERIESILDALTADQWSSPSAAPGWTITDTVMHLAVTEEQVATTLSHPESVWNDRDRSIDEIVDLQVRQEATSAGETFDRWRVACAASLTALRRADPDRRVRWAAAPLKPRTLATTRLAEHWAHALDIVEPLAIEYPDTDRLRHIAWLGHATLPYAMESAGLEPMPIRCTLTAPSGEIRTFGPLGADSSIEGHMGTFCRVGARRLDSEESGLAVSGPVARDALRVLRNYAV